MSILDFFIKTFVNRNYSRSAIPNAVVNFVMKSLTDKDGRIRAEDAIVLISTIVAEKCIDAAGDFSIYEHDMTPGSRVFSDKVNEILFGQTIHDNIGDFADESVVGQIRNSLAGSVEFNGKFPNIKVLVESFPQAIGKDDKWGTCPLSVPQNNLPYILPLRVGFETREQIDGLLFAVRDKQLRLQILIESLCKLLILTKDIIDGKIALLLAIETINGMAKTATITKSAMKRVAEENQTKS